MLRCLVRRPPAGARLVTLTVGSPVVWRAVRVAAAVSSACSHQQTRHTTAAPQRKAAGLACLRPSSSPPLPGSVQEARSEFRTCPGTPPHASAAAAAAGSVRRAAGGGKPHRWSYQSRADRTGRDGRKYSRAGLDGRKYASRDTIARRDRTGERRPGSTFQECVLGRGCSTPDWITFMYVPREVRPDM